MHFNGDFCGVKGNSRVSTCWWWENGFNFWCSSENEKGRKRKEKTLQIGFSPISKLADAKVGREKDEKTFQLSREMFSQDRSEKRNLEYEKLRAIPFLIFPVSSYSLVLGPSSAQFSDKDMKPISTFSECLMICSVGGETYWISFFSLEVGELGKGKKT